MAAHRGWGRDDPGGRGDDQQRANRGSNQDADTSPEIHDIIGEGAPCSQQIFDQALLKPVPDGVVSVADTMSTANRPHGFGLMLQRAGLVEASLALA